MRAMRAMRARNHGIMASWDQGEGGRGEAENREILIRAKVDFMFIEGGRGNFGALQERSTVYSGILKNQAGGGPSWPPKAARKNHQWLFPRFPCSLSHFRRGFIGNYRKYVFSDSVYYHFFCTNEKTLLGWFMFILYDSGFPGLVRHV